MHGSARNKVEVKPFMIHVEPTKQSIKYLEMALKRFQDKSMVTAIVLECGYSNAAQVVAETDELNRYDLPERVRSKPVPGLGSGPALFSFKLVEEVLTTTGLPVVVRGITNSDDAVKAAKAGASAIWISE